MVLSRARFVTTGSAAALVAASGMLPRGARAQSLEHLNIAVIPSDIAGQAYYAEGLGLFKRAGIETTIMPISNGGAISAAVVAGSADVGYSNVISLAAAHLRGLPLTILAPANMHLRSAPTSGILAVKKSSPYHDAKDLNGKTIAVNGIGNIVHIATRQWLDKNGGDSATVKFVELSLTTMVPALEAGRVDAAALDAIGDPTLGKADDPLRRIGSAYDAVALSFAPSVWFTTVSWAEKNPALLKKVVSIMNESAVWANAHHHESAAILAKFTQRPVEQIDGAVRATYGEKLTPELIQPDIDVAAKYGVISAKFSARDMISAAAL